MSYREFGLLSTLIMWVTIAYLLYKWRGKQSMSISLHAASARSAYYFFAAVSVLAGSLLAIFMFQWFIPEFGLDNNFKLIFYLIMLCFYANILIPETKGIRARLHRFFAYTMFLTLFAAVVYILTACNLSFTKQIIGGATLAYMAFCIISHLFVRKSPNHFIMRNFLRFQVIYLIVFQIFILAVTYL